MGIFKFIRNLFGSHDEPDEDELEEENMSYFDEEGGSTLIYTGEPDLNVTVSDPGGKGGAYNAAKLNAITNAEVAKVSDTHPVTGQVKKPRGRGQGVHPQQMPPQAPQAPQAQPAPQMEAAMAPQQPMYPQQQEYYQPPMRQPMQQYYPQQPYYQQPMMQPPMQIPVQQSDPDDPIQRCPANPGEPYTEMIILNGVYHFYVDLPGLKVGDFSLRYVNMHLVISGERKLFANQLSPKGKGKGNKGKRPEFAAQVTVPQQLEKFEYAFYFPRPVAPDSFKSELADGILHVEMTILAPPSNSGGIQISVG